MQQNQLSRMGYTNVTGLTCLSYGQDDMRFLVPSIEDHPGKMHISGKDFIFLLLENGQTWYKSVNLEIANRCSLYYMKDSTIVAMDSRNPVNTQGTVLAYPLKFDREELQMRKTDPDCLIKIPDDVISSAEIMRTISEAIAISTHDFLNYLLGKDYSDLKQFPNKAFLEAFDSDLVQDEPVHQYELRNLYMLVVLQVQRDGKFPYKLSIDEFASLVTLEKSAMRYR